MFGSGSAVGVSRTEMTKLPLLGAFLTERLTAVVKEVLDVVEDTVARYREETDRTRRENEGLRRQLRDILLLEAEWLRSTQSGLGLVPSEQQNNDLKPRTVLEEPDSIRTQSRPAPAPVHLLSVPTQFRPAELWDQTPKPDPLRRTSPVLTRLSLNPPRIQADGAAREEPPDPVRVLDPALALDRVLDPALALDRVKAEPREAGRDGAAECVEAPVESGFDSTPERLAADQQDASRTGPAGAAAAPGGRCPRCGEAFGHSAGLRLHLQQQRKPYGCDWCCKSFSQSADLRRHLRTHTGERPHRCGVCAKSFSQRGNLRRHLRIHTGERPYSCPSCCRRFSDGDTMKKHKRTHSGEKRLSCSRCARTFSSAGGLQLHLRREPCCRT